MLFVIFCLFVFSSNQTYSYDDTKLFSGSIEFPCKLDYDLCLFYQGQKLEFETSKTSPFVQFSFIDSKNTQTVYVIITNGLTCCTNQSNTVECLCVVDESSYICYKMTGKRETNEDEHQLLTWEISDYQIKDGQIPENSLIFLFEPSLIAGLKVQSWKPENVFRIIPTLVIAPSATADQIKRAMIIARLTALDIDAIHAKATKNNATTTPLLT